MVVDNADDDELFFAKKPYISSTGAEQPRPLFSYLPKSSRGSMLVTSRDMRLSQNLMDGDIPIKVLQLDMEEAEKLLYSQLPQDYISDKLSTTIILQKLDGLPLAITQATAFIKQNSITTADYIDILQTSDTDLIDLLSEDHLDPRRNLDSPNSVVQTWKISFDQIQRQNPRAAELLSLMAVLDRQGIPQSLLRKESERKTEFLVAIKKLEAFSLIKAENGQEVFVIHRLVQLATRNWLALQQSSQIFETEALRVLSSKFPRAEYQNRKTCKALLPHAQVVLSYTLQSDSTMLHRADLLYAVSCYQAQALLDRALARFDQFQQISEPPTPPNQT